MVNDIILASWPWVAFILVYGLLFSILKYTNRKLMHWAVTYHHTTLLYILPPLVNTLAGALLLVMLNIFIPLLNLKGNLGVYAEKSGEVLLIATIGWVLYKILNSIEKYITDRYVVQSVDLFASRKINTQLTILKRILLIFIIIVTFSAILMIFDGIKMIGTSLLTTAGIISAIGAFASQQSLGRIFAGLQIAFTQPVRIGDTVVIDNEFGQIEEINLSFITVKLWDLRRLILPTDYFINKGLLNLTRQSSELLGTIFIYADYTLPVEEVREYFLSLLEQSNYWNKRVGKLEVTDIKERTMEIRCLMSADNSDDLWKLRCDIREKLIKYVVEKYPDCLTKTRNITI